MCPPDILAIDRASQNRHRPFFAPDAQTRVTLLRREFGSTGLRRLARACQASDRGSIDREGRAIFFRTKTEKSLPGGRPIATV